jgi:hypothetical protein
MFTAMLGASFALPARADEIQRRGGNGMTAETRFM